MYLVKPNKNFKAIVIISLPHIYKIVFIDPICIIICAGNQRYIKQLFSYTKTVNKVK